MRYANDTINRATLLAYGYVQSTGKGRSAGYHITILGKLALPVDSHSYCEQSPDVRDGYERYDDTLFPSLPPTFFTQSEHEALDDATATFRERSTALTSTLAKKELERFVIELSWKSSRIEGNTYTLLDTERLIRDGIEAANHTHEEAVMILNHKKAFEFVREHSSEFRATPSRAAIEELHRILTDGLHVGRGIRKQVVGITGTRYRPLENQFQIHEAMDSLRAAIGSAADPYTAALTALLGMSYIQAFEDGNKRTARLFHIAAPMKSRIAKQHSCSTRRILSYRLRNCSSRSISSPHTTTLRGRRAVKRGTFPQFLVMHTLREGVY